MELTIPWPREQVAGVITQVIERNAYTHAAIRILVTGGISEDTILPGAQSTLAVLITPLGCTK